MNLYPAPPPARLAGIPDGIAGVRETLRAMARIVQRYKTDPGIYTLSRQLTRHLPSNDVQGEIRAIHAFVRDKVRYINDVEDVETLQTPDYTLKCGQGDCDDKAMLVNTLLAATGRKTFFLAVGLDEEFYSHVLGGVRLGTRQIPLETIVPNVPPGWLHPRATSFFTWNV